jgi:hypothetical protein
MPETFAFVVDLNMDFVNDLREGSTVSVIWS